MLIPFSGQYTPAELHEAAMRDAVARDAFRKELLNSYFKR